MFTVLIKRPCSARRPLLKLHLTHQSEADYTVHKGEEDPILPLEPFRIGYPALQQLVPYYHKLVGLGHSLDHFQWVLLKNSI